VAAQLLSGQGFREVYNLKGGIKAWQGVKAVGPLELNLDLIQGDESPLEIIALAYGMEEALRRFYVFFQDRAANEELRTLLANLAGAEENHKETLRKLYLALPDSSPESKSWEEKTPADVLEGGFRFADFVRQNEPLLKSPADVLETALMLETQALDLYLRFAAREGQGATKNVLFRLSDEEKAHLAALGRGLDERQQQTVGQEGAFGPGQAG
jgi:sulfur-carrier protein adenylyltransferase/sulfurtransferase